MTPRSQDVTAGRPIVPADSLARRNFTARTPARDGPAVSSQPASRSTSTPSAGSRTARKPSESFPERSTKQLSTLTPLITTSRLPATKDRVASSSTASGASRAQPIKSVKQRTEGSGATHLRLATVRTDISRTPSLVSASTLSTSGSPQLQQDTKRTMGVHIPTGLPSTSTQAQRSTSTHAKSFQMGSTLRQRAAPSLPTALHDSSPHRGGFGQQKEEDHTLQLNRYMETAYNAPERYGPTPPYALINTPCTNYSPGPFSISSTPTSMSSYSPGTSLTTSQKPTIPRLRQPSPGLLQPIPQVRQVYVSSRSVAAREHSASSSSTIRPTQRNPNTGADASGSLAVNASVDDMTLETPNYKASDAHPRVFPEFRHLNNVVPLHQARKSRTEPTISLLEALDVHPSSNDHHAISTLNTNIRFNPTFATRKPSPTRSQASLTSPFNTRPPTREPTPDAKTPAGHPSEAMPQPSQRPKSSRFGFLSKKTKSDHTPRLLTKEKPVRKGPAAGTGHEGYARFAGRGRSGSTTSGSGVSLGAERSPSVDSDMGLHESPSRKSSIGSKVSGESDDFVIERLTPVTLRGTGPSRSGPPVAFISATGLPKSSVAANGLGASTISSGDLGSLRHGQGRRPALLPSPIPDHNQASFDGKAVAADDEINAQTTALPQVPPASGPRLSMNLNSAFGKGRAFGRFQQKPAGMGTDVSTSLNPAETDRHWVEEPSASSSLRAPKILNFFHRTRSPVRQTHEELKPDTVPVVLKTLPRRSMAHYAFSTTPKRINLEELEQIMREAEEGGPAPNVQSVKPSIPAVDAAQNKEEAHQEARLVSTPEPQDWMRSTPRSTPVKAPAVVESSIVGSSPSPVKPLDSETVDSKTSLDWAAGTRPQPLPAPEFELKPRIPRLQQVGRIPKVVSTRPKHKEHTRQLSEASFSRPFAPSNPSPATRTSVGNTLDFILSQRVDASTDRESIMAPVMLMHSPNLLNLGSFEISPGASRPSTRINSSDLEYIRLMGQKYADRSSSSSCGSFPITAALTSLKPELPLIVPEEDVWGEYDDLLDALSPQEPKTPKSAVSVTSSAGAPFRYDAAFDVPKIAPLPDLPDGPVAEDTVPRALAPRVVSTMQRVRLRSKSRSRHLSTVPALVTPTSPMSISDYLDSYSQERFISVLDPVSGRLSLPAQPRDSTGSARRSLPISIHTRSSTNSNTQPQTCGRDSLPATKRISNRRDSRMMEQAENHHLGTESMASLRFDALMASKWLSFGRVLFSPIHYELKDPAHDRILVLDGLGKDWSHYLALTYPQATVFNLGPEAPTINSPSNATIDTLPNYRHITYASLSSPLPFPKGFFAAVVFRFPIATSEAAYRTAISECKRVLRPGGYLELSVLDIDMLHMGNRARQAVRQLKMEMQTEDPATSLKPLSDTVQTLLGRRGFENLNRCFVQVPVTALATTESKTDSDMEDTARVDTHDKKSSHPKSHRKTLSLITDKIASSTAATAGTTTSPLQTYSDLVRDQSKEGEEGMVKMVARVARWWYMRCYESVVLPGNDVSKSIWADEALREECEKKGTGLRLMVCFAQKPICSVRRTASL